MRQKTTIKDLIRQGAVWYAQKSEFCPCLSSASQFHSFAVSRNLLGSPLTLFSPGGIHEISLELTELNKSTVTWAPPLQFTTKILEQATVNNENTEKNFIVWVGQKCWPSSFLLSQLTAYINSSTKISHLFIDAKNNSKRQIAAIQNLRSPFVIAVICDGSGLKFIETRKLQLAAAKGKSLGIIIKPPWEQKTPSAAQTKWKIKPNPTNFEAFSCLLTLTRARGLLEPMTWELEISLNKYEKDSLHILADASRRSEKAKAIEIKRFAA